jgi:hypothetical protein
MTLELVTMVLGGVYLLVRLDGWLAQRWLQKMAAQEAAHIAHQAAVDAAPPAQTTLRVPGTQALARKEFRRVARFGLAAEHTVDLLVYDAQGPVESWPRQVNELARALYRKGQARGPGVVQLLMRKSGLSDGEGLYFALLDADADGPREVYAFVDDLC